MTHAALIPGEFCEIAAEAFIDVYPLVSMALTRRVMTNRAQSRHARTGQHVHPRAGLSERRPVANGVLAKEDVARWKLRASKHSTLILGPTPEEPDIIPFLIDKVATDVTKYSGEKFHAYVTTGIASWSTLRDLNRTETLRLRRPVPFIASVLAGSGVALFISIALRLF